MQFMPSEHQPPFPFIRLAEACDEMIGEGIERIKIASANAAIAGRIHFMVSSFLQVKDAKPGQARRRQYLATAAPLFQS
jgi:hypothetical protein